MARPVPPLPPLDLESGLRKLGFERFRPGQREAIETLLSNGSALLVAPTGGGKSLTYQLPAALMGGTTLVVSPLIALMNDQVAALEERGVRATYLAATLDRDELYERIRGIARGDYEIVYVAPERLVFPGFRSLLSDIDCPLLAVDEAHCISEWGHDFRPEYMQVGDVLGRLPKARVLACTATATPVVRDEIIARLGLPSDTPQLVQGFARPNLVLRATEVQSKSERERHVEALLREALGGPGSKRGTAIVYSPTRKQSEQEAVRLARMGWTADAYHAGLEPGTREEVQRRFSEGELEVVVATNAFGMGIDRSDVRAVVHLAPPGSIESYYQEVGRAGRDGDTAWGLLLTSSGDMPLRRRLIEADTDGRAPDAAVVEHKWNLFLELMRWVEGGSCRHDAILRYFGDDAETLGGCGRCDVCCSLDETGNDPEEVTLIVRKALSGVARVHGRYGLSAAVKLLKGVSDQRLARAGLDAVSTFGILSEHSEEWLTKLLRRCVTAGWVVFGGEQRPVVLVTEEGRDVMHARAPARLMLPPKATRTRSAPRRRTETAPAPAIVNEEAYRLFEALRAHRTDVARANNVPPYVVASDRALRALCEAKPQTEDELMQVHGFGAKRIERYGDGFLRVLREH